MNKRPELAKQKVVIVGAGIIGLTTALSLAESGFGVTIIEQENTACAGTSKANAGQLLFSRISATGSPGFLRSLPKTLLDRGQGVVVTGLASPKKWPWATAFLRECTTARWQENTSKMLKIAARSRSAFTVVRKKYALDFDWRASGKLIVHPTPEHLAAATRVAEFQAQFGGSHHILGADECFALEPALRGTTRPIAGGVHIPDAEVGDCCKFGQNLATLLVEKFNVKIRYGMRVSGLNYDAGRITAIRCGQELIGADFFVLATGNAAEKMLPVRFSGKKRITGVKGISLTFPAGSRPPNLSVAEAAGKLVILRLNDRVRLTGYAVFSDRATTTRTQVQNLIQKAQALMPQAAQYDATPEVWAGLRPQTPDDVPMIGPAGADNLFVNAGHGSLGWILAMGSAEILLEAVLDSLKQPRP